MYRTAKGEEIFVIDGHTHFWDGSPANQKNIHGKQFIECFYAYHSNLSPPSEKWEKEKFEKYDAKTMFDATPVTDKSVAVVPGGKHGVALVAGPGRVRSLVESFLRSHSAG